MNEHIIETDNLTRRFGKVLAVQSLDLRVPQGSIYGFLGPNGAGKTTTIRMLLGLIRPAAGAVRLFGQPLNRNSLARVGALVEAPSLYPHLSGRENLEVTRRLTGARPAHVPRVLRLMGLNEAADRAVKGYSQGMKQRLALALALLNEPELLLLDEPTNGLDPAGIREIRELICRLPAKAGVTIFLSSHLLSEVEQVATHIGIIQAGRLRFQGAPDALHARTQDHVVLEVDQPQRAKQALGQMGWKIKSNGNHRLVIAANGQSDAALINGQLVRQGVNVYHLALQQPALEDIFLSLTENETR